MTDSSSKNNSNMNQAKPLSSSNKNNHGGDNKMVHTSKSPTTNQVAAMVKKQSSDIPNTPKGEHSSTFKLPKQTLDNMNNDSPVLVPTNNAGSGHSPLPHSTQLQQQQQQQQSSTSTGIPLNNNQTESHPPVNNGNTSQLVNPTPNPSLINTISASAGGVPISTGNTPAAPTPASGLQTPTILNKNTITNITKSLKAKQKVIHSRETHPKNATLISNIINTSPQSTVFPNLSSNNITKDGDSTVSLLKNNNTGRNNPIITTTNDTLVNNATPKIVNESAKSGTNDGSVNTQEQSISNQPPQSQNISQSQVTSQTPLPLPLPPPPPAASFMMHANNSATNMSTSGSKHDTLDSQSKQNKKKISKQNSTKTDFFAARLASAVDDIDSSDSDETFVYENNDNGFDNNNTNLDNASISGSIAAPGPINGSITGGGGGSVALRTPSILDGEQLSHYYDTSKQPFKLPSNKAPSIANSITSNNNNLDLNLKRAPHLRDSSGYSTNDNDPRTMFLPNVTDKLGSNSPANMMYENMSEFARNSSVNHSINDYNDDTFSYNEVEDDLVDVESTDDGDIGRSNNTTIVVSSNQQSQPQQSQPQPQLQSSQQQLQPQPSQQQLQAPPSVTPSLSTKNASKRNYKSSTSSSKLRSTASKLFDKKGSQPRRYSIIPDDIDIEDLDEDEFMYYDNNVRFPPNETSSLLKSQRIPHYRSLNLNYPVVKRQNKRYLSTGQPLESSDHGSTKEGNNIMGNNNNNNGNNRAFPFPYQDQSYNYYYDYDDFDQESQRYSPNFDLPDLPLNRAGSRNFTNNGLPQNRFGNGHFFLPRKSDQQNSRTSICKSCIYMFLSLLVVLSVGFMFGFILATTKDLTDVGITSIENPIVSKDELVFNIVVEAFNPGWFSVDISEVELDLFARSGYLPDDGDDDDDNNSGLVRIKSGSQKVETVKLGTILNLESTMNFKGGIISREPSTEKGEVKLLDPGKNITVETLGINSNNKSDDNSKKWEIICANPFDLIITGVLKYDLPFARTTRSVVVRKTGYIDPTLFVIPQDN